MKRWNWIILGVVGFLMGCSVTTPQAFYEAAPQDWTHQQKLTAFFYALQKETTTVTPTGRSLRRDLVDVDKTLYLAERIRSDLDWFMNNEKYVDYLLWSGSRHSFNETKGTWDYIAKCLRAFKIQGDLVSKLGIKLSDPLLKSKSYDQRMIVACPALADQLKLVDPRVEEAMKSGRLLPSQIVKVELADPLGTVTLEATTYLIQPDATQTEEEALKKFYAPGIYAEIKREGESRPIVRLYRSPDSNHMDMVVVDEDLSEYFGYGLPDKLETVNYANALEYIASQAKSLIPREFHTTTLMKKKQVPTTDEVYVVRAASTAFQAWEEGNFTVPIDYDSKESIADVRLKKVELARSDGLKEVEFYISRYDEMNVWEYFTPKPAYRLIRDYATFGSEVTLQLKGKPAVTAPPEALGKLTYVMYREGDNKGWILWDSNGDGKFDKRRPIYWQSQSQP